MANYLLITLRAIRMMDRQTTHLAPLLRLWFLVIALSLLFIEFGRQIRYRLRRRIGDSSKRAVCCGWRPDRYERTGIKAVPRLSTVRRSNEGYTEYYDCTICGQGWMQSIGPEDVGKGLRWDVRKT